MKTNRAQSTRRECDLDISTYYELEFERNRLAKLLDDDVYQTWYGKPIRRVVTWLVHLITGRRMYDDEALRSHTTKD